MEQYKFNDQFYPVKFDWSVIKTSCAKLDVTNDKLLIAILKPENLELVFVECLHRGHKLEGKTFELTQDQVGEFMFEYMGEFTAYVNKSLWDSMQPKSEDKKKFMAQIQAIAEKMKLT